MSLPSFSRTVLRRVASCASVAAMPLFFGGWLNWLSGPQSTFDVAGPVAKSQLDVFYVTLWVTGIIFVIVASVLTYATLKYKARNAADEHAPTPPQGHGNPLVELSLIAASVLALVFIAVPTLKAIWYNYDVPAAEKQTALEITSTAYQWWFKFEYPSEQIDGAGPLVTANELVIPAGRAISINLRTVDVIHSFWVPKLAGKVDMIPNRGNHLWLKADKPGYFWGQCAEYCGEDHAVMRFRVIALDAKDYAAWLAHQKAPARSVTADDGKPGATYTAYTYTNPGRNAPGYTAAFDADPLGSWFKWQKPEADEDPVLIAKGRKLFQEKTCIGCHAVRGQEGVGVSGPDLTHIGSRTTIAAGLLENSKFNLHRWLTDPNGVKPGNKMWTTGYNSDGKTVFRIDDEEARALVAYLHSLK
ncbi:MAG TPA: cytochrome c oxidase subunit II [Rariglobus sp.]|jgi:cytochrome c oxidase subunit 2|nr:cytochrome c oxidase subunit II [Rariglobus sp.]